MIDFEIKNPYIYCFGRSCNAWICLLSKFFSILGRSIIPHALTSESRIIISTLSLKQVIEEFFQRFPPSVNHPYHLILFLTGTVIFFLPRKREDLNKSKWYLITVLEKGGNT